MAGKANTYATVDLSGRDSSSSASLLLLIDGLEIPIVSFSMTYGLNAIPTANAAVPLGRNARTGKKSAIYDAVSGIRQMKPVTVKLEGSLGDWSPAGIGAAKQQFPSGSFTIFTGYISGVSYRRNNGSIMLVLSMVNTLIDLALSSTGSRDVVPGAPHDIMLPLVGEKAGAKTSIDASSKFVSELPQSLNIDASKALLDVMYSVAQDNLLQVTTAWCQGNVPAGFAGDLLSNSRATQAIEGVLDWKGFSNYADANGRPAYIRDYPLEINVRARQTLSKSVGARLAASFAGTTMWHALIGSIIPEIGLSVVPLADSALLVPAFEMARDAGATIWTSDIADINLGTKSQRPLFGVGVMQNQFMGSLPIQDKQCVGGYYTAELAGVADGMWLFVPAPNWLTWDAIDDKAINGNPSVNNLLVKPSNTTVGTENIAVDDKPGEAVADWNNVSDKYAQMVYAANALAGREGTITGKLRFDIAPGTTIKIQANKAAITQGVDDFAAELYGFVNRVTVTINAQDSSATTTFNLANLRTADENKLDRFSMTQHPFYGFKYFNYAPLVPGLAVK